MTNLNDAKRKSVTMVVLSESNTLTLSTIGYGKKNSGSPV